MRVSFITTSFPKFPNDSHAPWLLSMGRRLVEDGCSVNVIAPSAEGLPLHDKFGGLNVVRFRYMTKALECVAYGANIPANVASSKRAKFAFPFFCVGFLLAAIRELNDCDLVHAQFGYSGVFAAVADSLIQRRKPLVVSFYGRDVAHAKKFPWLYGLLFRKATSVLVLAEDMRQKLLERGCPPEKLRVHHLGIDCRQFEMPSRQERDGALSFLIVANFVEKKGISVAIDAFARLVRRMGDAQLKILGRGPLENALRCQADALGLSKNIFFINNYDSPDPRGCVLEAMKGADIFLLPGINASGDYGGTPVVLMEAGAMGLPAITTDNAGNAEVVCDGMTGLVVPENDVETLYLAMKRLAESPLERRRLGAAAREHIFREFNEEVQMKKLGRIYQEVTA